MFPEFLLIMGPQFIKNLARLIATESQSDEEEELCLAQSRILIKVDEWIKIHTPQFPWESSPDSIFPSEGALHEVQGIWQCLCAWGQNIKC